MKGLMVDVYKCEGLSHSNKGISAFAERVTIVGDGIVELFEEDPLTRPAVKIVKRELSNGPYLHAEPLEKPTGKTGPMFGGCFIYSSDSRFRKISAYPIPLHDRFEKGD